jgi:hypothetical protein
VDGYNNYTLYWKIQTHYILYRKKVTAHPLQRYINDASYSMVQYRAKRPLKSYTNLFDES